MNKVLLISYCCLALGVHGLQAQRRPKTSPLRFTVAEAPEWTQLFRRNNGWFGGDGIFSIPLNGNESNGSQSSETLFIFSDSMIGSHADGKLQPGSKMLHNSVAILSGQQADSAAIKFHYPDTGSAGAGGLFVPATAQTKPGDYYWLGDGFVNEALNNKVFIFGYRIRTTGAGAFGFSETGNCLIGIDQKDLRTAGKEGFSRLGYQQKDTPFYFPEERSSADSTDTGNSGQGSFGAGIYVNTKKAGALKPDGYVYIYGIRGKAKKLLVARVLPRDFEDYSKWMFLSRTNWTNDMQQARSVAEGVSNELSLSALPNGKFALIYQERGLGRHVCMRVGGSPYGPFGPEIKLWDCSPALTRKSYFPYNAKAHPSLSGKNELLISYNINSFDFFKDLETDPQLYRPRFIRVKFG
ncbi:DUF4185 domain-containing protein [Pedobacter sp. JY14-1]|uniref:DUF4185 domain-containing protein n=1 Tax=Pedobacter sp. JY14-1 TaxID=3034151 RepID=UPI0023E1F8A2|nr:DUF4185 domain-containing protein [Pedobacter sp. JY14-1]